MSASGDLRDREERAAKNQSLFREINENVTELNQAFRLVAPLGEWICECANESCIVTVEMTRADYEEIRGDGARFLVAPSDEHVWPDVERIIERLDRYWVLEKTGHAGDLAKRSDPRSGGGPLTLRT
jgi:hypothetical protein